MAVNYYLRPNKLGQNGRHYMANVISNNSVELEEIVEEILRRGSTVTRADVMSVLTEYHNVIEYYLQSGSNVRTPLVNFSSSIGGIFNFPTDHYDPARHVIRPVTNPGRRLQGFYRDHMSANLVEPRMNIPHPEVFKDVVSGERNGSVTPLGMAKLLGRRLKINGREDGAGIFFIDGGGREIPVTFIGQNYPSELIFTIPRLSPGHYSLEIRTHLKKLLRRGRLQERLYVLG
jgi:hypothetical protein